MSNLGLEKDNQAGTKKRSFFERLVMVIIFVAVILFSLSVWYAKTYGEVGFDSIVYTIFSNKEGAENGIVLSLITKAILPAVAASILILFMFFSDTFKKKWHIKRFLSIIVSLAISFVLIFQAGVNVDFFDYVYASSHQSKIFEEKYVDPNDAKISFPEKKRNLIYIFLESVETTFFSKDVGGAMDVNVMPELYNIAEENINFSHNDGVGGFKTVTGTNWTAAAMVAQTAGIPLKETSGMFKRNEYGKESFLPGATSITNILGDNGYNQALMVGSFASFANRDTYYNSHGVDTIYDLNTAREEGKVAKDYYVWWGMEDMYLFDYAKDKILDMAKEDAPFAFSLLTVDTHFAGGYKCSMCKEEHDAQYENVYACSSRQVSAFVDWIKKQEFYENTTIVICGDHLTMDNEYISENVEEGYDRRVYNAILNSALSAKNSKNRSFTSFDMFPTTLAAMGCAIEGERLGLGTNLFSDAKTLAEEMGYGSLDWEVSLNSVYYIKEFVAD